jgi:hypothetical protein
VPSSPLPSPLMGEAFACQLGACRGPKARECGPKSQILRWGRDSLLLRTGSVILTLAVSPHGRGVHLSARGVQRAEGPLRCSHFPLCQRGIEGDWQLNRSPRLLGQRHGEWLADTFAGLGGLSPSPILSHQGRGIASRMGRAEGLRPSAFLFHPLLPKGD